MKIKGIVPPIGTPLTSDERVDEPGLRRLVNYLLDSGVDGIFANGSMSIFALLTDNDQLRAVETIVDEVNGRVPVIAGISDSGTRRVIEKAKEIQKLGVDCLSVLTPYYYLLTQESGTRFFREVAQAVEKPLFAYNNPVLTKFNLSVESVIELAAEPNIIGIKDSNQDANRWTQLTAALGGRDDFSILIGTEGLIPVAFMLGVDGAIGGAHNFAAPIAVELYRAALANDYGRAFELSGRLVKACEIFQYGEIWGAFEVAMQHIGIADKFAASPYRAATQSEREKVVAILKECGIESAVAVSA